MAIRTRITQAAKERGLTAAELARKLGFYRSNISAMDRGKRSVSLHTLDHIARTLGLSPSDLLDVNWGPEVPLFSRQNLSERLKARDLGTPDGLERNWLHTLLLAWQRHHRAIRSRP